MTDLKKDLKLNKKGPIKINIGLKQIVIAIVALFFISSILISAGEIATTTNEKPISKIISDIKAKKVKKIEIVGNKVLVHYSKDRIVTTSKEEGESFVKTLTDAKIDPTSLEIRVKSTDTGSMIANFLANVIPTLLMIGFFIFIFRQARGTQDSIFSFGQARSKLYNKEMSRITFDDVAGVDEAKKELAEIVDFLKNPKKYNKLGARPPKGVILVGPSGTGKTLLAKAVAGESHVPFFSVAGSEFMEMLVGIGAARVRDLFKTAKKNSPSIIFIDEIDAIGRTRSVSAMPAHDEREQTLNQILVEMDGFEQNDRVIVVAATNRGDLLDSALLRPGRFDRRVLVDYPDIEGRKAILKIHSRGKPMAKNVSWEKVAKRTVGFSGADIENMLNEAAILAATRNKSSISMDEIEEAATKVKLGPEKKRLQTDMDKKITAYHEAGHAIVTYFQKGTDPVHRISIVSRGMALGYTLIPPSSDRLHETKTHLVQMITSMMGGRAAENLVFKDITTGAANDFDQATRIARGMVIDYGMSSLGPINYGPTSDVTEWGSTFYASENHSDATRLKIDNEIRKIVEDCYGQAKKILKTNRKKLDAVAFALIKKESLDDEEFLALVVNKLR
ncbi:cell division protein FtsH [Candidatus Roizmanbacteria bacterium RIFCSPHIGHO2_01_FULL_39_12b]|uniref:ATP-dependent zinc metalloprotease FtsH n=1 Tax=Candidatus Roizmanbacteria bacterium RIFCSPHIGHO2_01_FULL_39_12b TaxID=1802030 RepID=A0A1F7GEC8_9BACT|nr:MAG: cell division protein FtsH [Candidatus Roizmanbacteria bacterium RIFCSPHIGHO2_01_FULL_39_12b]OGK47046.1 MAG: cell division protein FtsH [Candidatus Roizmanbacteria bacterium RIFCSPLOWO2_01_FULL_39_19]